MAFSVPSARHEIQRTAVGAAGDQEAGRPASSTIACGPMPASLCVMPPANSAPTKGARTLENSLGRSSGGALGTSAWAAVNSALVDGLHDRRRRLAEIRRRRRDLRRCAQIDARSVAGHRAGRRCRLLLIARVVGRQAQELVGVPGAAHVHQAAAGLRQLVLPDDVIAAVGRDIQRDVVEAGAAGIVDRAPGHVVVVRRADLRRGQRRRRRHLVHRLGQRLA